MVHSRIAVVVFLIFLAGCANNNVWVKEGASKNDFESDKYSCLQQSQQQEGSAVVNQYGGSARNGAVTNGILYNSCMGSKGWSLQNQATNQAVMEQNQADFNQKKSEYQEAISKLGEKNKAICSKPEYAMLFTKTACNANDITFENIADSTKITQEQKTVFPKYRTEVDAVFKEFIVYAHANGKDKDKQWADYLDSIQTEIDKYTLGLYSGAITWGEYNQYRKGMNARHQVEWKRIFGGQ
jgi:hypothetical protein